MKYYCGCGERFIRKINYDLHIRSCPLKNKDEEDKNYWKKIEKSDFISNDIELEKQLFIFFRYENLKNIFDYGNVMKKYNNNFIKTDLIQNKQNILFDWVLKLNTTFDDCNLLELNNKNKYGMILSGDNLNMEYIKKIKKLGYIYDEEASILLSEKQKLFEKIIVFRKINYYKFKDYDLIFIYNKPMNLNKEKDLNKCISHYNLYKKYFLNEQAGIYNNNNNNKYLNNNSIMIDIGANIGLSCVPILSLNHRVYCFEPEKINLEILKEVKRVNNFNNMIINNEVVFDYDGEISFYSNYNNEDNSSISRECCGKNINPLEMIVKKYPCIKLDTWYKKNKINAVDIKLIKIDTQGSEYEILKGARDLLIDCSKFTKCNIEIECDENFLKIRGITFDMICNYMDSVGFKLYKKDYDCIFIPKLCN